LEASFLVHQVAGHRPMEHRTLTAHPKIHVVDTSLAAWAARIDETPSPAIFGAMLETFVINELVAQASWLHGGPTIRHWRDTAKKLEVDAVILHENGRSVAIEVKAGADVHKDDLKGLRGYLSTVNDASMGIIFYTGERTLKLDEAIWAIPISALWTGLATTKNRS
jgi:uncharacterized protein